MECASLHMSFIFCDSIANIFYYIEFSTVKRKAHTQDFKYDILFMIFYAMGVLKKEIGPWVQIFYDKSYVNM